MGEYIPRIKPPDSVLVANRKLKRELPVRTVKEIIDFSAPIDEEATKNLDWEPPEEKRQ